MAGPLDFIPKIEGFNPIPVGIMISFMKAQTAWMMYAGGYNWQFGKRTVDSMSNEEFNKRKDNYELVIIDQHRIFKLMVSAMEREIREISHVQKDLIDKMVDLEREKIKVLPELIAQIPTSFFEGLAALGGQTVDTKTVATARAKIQNAPIKTTTTSTPAPATRGVTPRSPLANTQENRDAAAILKLNDQWQADVNYLASHPSKKGRGYSLNVNSAARKKKQLLQLRNKFKAKYGYYV